MNITKSVVAKVKLLIFEQLACSLLVGKHQLRAWRCHLNFDKGTIVFPHKLQDDMKTPISLEMAKVANQDE